MELNYVLSAIVLNIANLIFSIYYTKIIIKNHWKSFIKKFYTMMIIRLIIVLVLFIILLKVFNFSELYFSIAFFLSYFVVLIIEILYLNKR